jgi:LacI family transcriptional regulator, galactose operon repressor
VTATADEGAGSDPAPSSTGPVRVSVTRDDVARLAGVSPAVVSYVLNAGPRPVSEAKRLRVEEAVAALSYRPDARARSLRLGRTHAIGLVVPDAANPFFAEVAQAIERSAAPHGLAVLMGTTSNDPAKEAKYLEDLAERRVDGIILISSRSDQDLSPATTLAVPVVVMDRAPDDSPISTIAFDNVGGAATATRHLIEHGHGTVHLVAGPLDVAVSGRRIVGWQSALQEAGLPVPRPTHTPFTYEGGRKAARLLFARRERPTAVVVSSDVQAIGVVSATAELGLRIPEDLAVVSVDGTRAAAFANPAITTLSQPIERMARRAVATIVARGTEPVHAVICGTLTVRRSCGCRADGQPC